MCISYIWPKPNNNVWTKVTRVTKHATHVPRQPDTYAGIKRLYDIFQVIEPASEAQSHTIKSQKLNIRRAK